MSRIERVSLKIFLKSTVTKIHKKINGSNEPFIFLCIYIILTWSYANVLFKYTYKVCIIFKPTQNRCIGNTFP